MTQILFLTSNLFRIKKKRSSTVFPNDIHLQSAMDWLARAQDQGPDDGVSEAFHLYHGWIPSYPETTGYIIETFFDYYYYKNKNNYRERALKMADWLVSIQQPDGAFLDSYLKNRMIFDTGQILFGLVRSYEESKDEKYKVAAINAGNWLIGEQEEKGTWINCAYKNIPHTYYSRVAWSLLHLHKIEPRDQYLKGCKKNMDWVLSCQDENGWFNNASFTLKNHKNPFTHTIAYTIRGILESGIYLNDERLIKSALKAIDSLTNKIPSNGFVCGTYDRDWNGDNKFCCLTGSAQLAIIFFKLYKLIGDVSYLNTGCNINQFLKSKQDTETKYENLKGAIAGSCPIWGKYIHFSYPNWAAKFFVESLLIEESLKKQEHE